MIVVTIEYDKTFLSERLEDTVRGYGGDVTLDGAITEALCELRDASESIVGLVFSEEQERVDVRIRPFGPHDQFEEPLFITIDVDDTEFRGQTVRSLCEQFIVHFGTHIDAYVPGHVPFRVWTRRISGSFAETGPLAHR